MDDKQKEAAIALCKELDEKAKESMVAFKEFIEQGKKQGKNLNSGFRLAIDRLIPFQGHWVLVHPDISESLDPDTDK